MRTSKIHRIISLMLAMLLLVSSTGFSMDVHYCQGQVKSISFFGKAKSCHEQAAKKHCRKFKKSCHAAAKKSAEASQCKKNCCSNKTVKIEPSDSDKAVSTLKVPRIQAQFLTAFFQVFLLERTDRHKAIIPHLNYVPPLLSKDIPVLIQSFLL